MGSAIDVVDLGDSRLADDVLGFLNKTACQSRVITIPNTDDAVGYMTRAVCRSAKSRDLWVLRIWGHGGCGMQMVGAGEDGYYGEDWRGGITTDNIDNIQETLAPLRALFVNERARLELRGCIAGFSSFGTALMLKLAKMLGCRVHASSEFQAGLSWIGQVWEADPYGSMRRVEGYNTDGSTGPHFMPKRNFIY